MHSVLILVLKDFSQFFRNKAAVLLAFIVPFALIYVFGEVFGVNRNDRGPTGIRLAVVNESDQPSAARLVIGLRADRSFRIVTKFENPDGSERPLVEADLPALIRADEFRFALVLPKSATEPDAGGLRLKIYSNPRNDIEAQTVRGLLQKAIFTQMPELLGMPSNSAASVMARVRVETVQVVGRDVRAPAATRIVGGWAMQFLLFVLSASASYMFYERDGGLFQRILAAPVTRAQILWSKFIYGVCLGLFQLTVLFVAGRILYGIDIEHHAGLLLVVCVFAAASCAAFGMLLASISSSPEAANGLATLLILLMSAVGGAWFPISFMPEFMQRISKYTLVYWSMRGFDQVLWAGASFGELLPTLGILASITAAVMAIAVWRCNRGRMFD